MTDRNASLGARLEQVLRVMKSARLKNEPMSVWPDDVKAVEDALRAHSFNDGVEAAARLIEDGAGMADLVEQEFLDQQAKYIRSLSHEVGSEVTHATKPKSTQNI